MIIINPWKKIRMLEAQAEKREEYVLETIVRVVEMEDALFRISQLETPRASNVVKKAARIARQGLGWSE